MKSVSRIFLQLHNLMNDSNEELKAVEEESRSYEEIKQAITENGPTQEIISEIVAFLRTMNSTDSSGFTEYLYTLAYQGESEEIQEMGQKALIETTSFHSFNPRLFANKECFEQMVYALDESSADKTETKTMCSIIVMATVLELVYDRSFIDESIYQAILGFCSEDISNCGLLYVLLNVTDEMPAEAYEAVIPFTQKLIEFNDTSVSAVGLEFLLLIISHTESITDDYLSEVLGKLQNYNNDSCMYKRIGKILLNFHSPPLQFMQFLVDFIHSGIYDMTVLCLQIFNKFAGSWPEDFSQQMDQYLAGLIDEAPYKITDEALVYFAKESDTNSNVPKPLLFSKYTEHAVSSNYMEMFLEKMCMMTEEVNNTEEDISEMANAIDDQWETFEEIGRCNSEVAALCEKLIQFASDAM